MDIEIPNLSEKMNFLHTGSQIARRIAGFEEGRGLQELCKLIGISREAIRDQIKKGKIRSDFEIKIAKRFQFYEREPAWTHWRRGTRDQFKTAYEALHKEETQPCQLTAERSGNNPWQEDNMLATLELFSVEDKQGRSKITATLSCQPAPFELGEIAVRGGKLSIRFHGGVLKDLADRSKERKWPPITNDAQASIRLIKGGTSQERAYLLSVDEGWLGEVHFPEGSWLLSDIDRDNGINFTFKAFIGDLHICNSRSHSFVKADGSPLSEAGEKILERFQVARLGADDSGWIELCGDGLRFVAPR